MTTYTITPGAAKFLLGVPTYAQLKPTRMPEIAFVGRSNVGKSSLINRLLGTKALARTSSNPGKTQEINLFQTELKSEIGEKTSLIIADLPGYGFAKLSKVERERMGKLTAEYISQRKELEIVMLLQDSKRLPEEEELSVMKLAIKSNRSLMIVLTKIDRLSQKERTKAINDIAAAYDMAPEQLVITGNKTTTAPIWSLVGATLWGD